MGTRRPQSDQPNPTLSTWTYNGPSDETRQQWARMTAELLRRIADDLDQPGGAVSSTSRLAREADRLLMANDPRRSIRLGGAPTDRATGEKRDGVWQTVAGNAWAELPDAHHRLSDLSERGRRVLSPLLKGSPLPDGTAVSLRQLADALNVWPLRPTDPKQLLEELDAACLDILIAMLSEERPLGIKQIREAMQKHRLTIWSDRTIRDRLKATLAPMGLVEVPVGKRNSCTLTDSGVSVAKLRRTA